MKTTYVHVQTPLGRSLGFSARLAALAYADDAAFDERGNKMCFLSITFCNKADKHFNKKIARAELEVKPEQWVRCIDVPELLADALYHCYQPYQDAVDSKSRSSQFNYILKRFL